MLCGHNSPDFSTASFHDIDASGVNTIQLPKTLLDNWASKILIHKGPGIRSAQIGIYCLKMFKKIFHALFVKQVIKECVWRQNLDGLINKD